MEQRKAWRNGLAAEKARVGPLGPVARGLRMPSEPVKPTTLVLRSLLLAESLASRLSQSGTR